MWFSVSWLHRQSASALQTDALHQLILQIVESLIAQSFKIRFMQMLYGLLLVSQQTTGNALQVLNQDNGHLWEEHVHAELSLTLTKIQEDVPSGSKEHGQFLLDATGLFLQHFRKKI